MRDARNLDDSELPPGGAVVDAVVIGRNEGARLVACLASLRGQVRRVVYVDSGSTDGSVAAAEAAGAEVVGLDMGRPFTAARARNAGLARLEGAGFVQLVDGDCEVRQGWVAAALAALPRIPRRWWSAGGGGNGFRRRACGTGCATGNGTRRWARRRPAGATR